MYTSVLNNSVSNIQARNRCGEFGDVILTLWSWRACSALSGYRLCKHVGFMAESAGCVSMTTMLNCCQLVASWLAGWLAGWLGGWLVGKEITRKLPDPLLGRCT